MRIFRKKGEKKRVRSGYVALPVEEPSKQEMVNEYLLYREVGGEAMEEYEKLMDELAPAGAEEREQKSA